jgi:hypothetical protein
MTQRVDASAHDFDSLYSDREVHTYTCTTTMSGIDDSPGSKPRHRRRLTKRKEVLVDHLENRRKKRNWFASLVFESIC